MPSVRQIYAAIPERLPDELFEILAISEHQRIERIVSLGHASPEGFWYDQEQDEFVILLRGAARLRFEGEDPVEMKAGDYVAIPAHCRHRVDWTDPDQPTVWLAVHSPNLNLAGP